MTGRPLDCESDEQRNSEQKHAISTQDLTRFADEYLLDCEYRNYSPATIAQRKIFYKNLVWFLDNRSYTLCGPIQLKGFFVYLVRGHEEPGGRFGRAWLKKTVRPATVKDYWVNINCLFNWMVEERLIAESPMKGLYKPRVPEEKTEPFTKDQILAILHVASQSQHPRRNEAIVLFLLDTGVRAGELCGLKMKDVDLRGRSAYVLGKGNRHRCVYFSPPTAATLARYLRHAPRGDDEPVFLASRGARQGPLTVSGLRQMIERLTAGAGLKGRRQATHAFRHTCALQMLRNGCNIFALKEMLGHRSLTTCQTYLKLNQADVAEHHKHYSAVESLRR